MQIQTVLKVTQLKIPSVQLTTSLIISLSTHPSVQQQMEKTMIRIVVNRAMRLAKGENASRNSMRILDIQHDCPCTCTLLQLKLEEINELRILFEAASLHLKSCLLCVLYVFMFMYNTNGAKRFIFVKGVYPWLQ